MDYKEKIKALPNSPGIYIMKDGSDVTLYVGKAGNLKKRVSSYFYPHKRLSERIGSMLQGVADIAHIPTSTEAEALIYENSLIKSLKPKYNVALRDDKSYPMLKLTVNEAFPRLFITRQKKEDGSVYYGPYSDVKLLREALILLRQIFPLRSCGRMPKSVCLNYHIKQCLGPCAGEVDESRYDEVVTELKLFLEGRRAELLRVLSKKMAEASQKEEFEGAERLRRRIEALSAIKEKKVQYGPVNESRELKSVLGIKGKLDSIEAFDVSDIMGKECVGSMVYFYKGKPKKSEYRKFKIKSIDRMDDYAMMRELINRRYSRVLEEGGGLPDLILIDGGKGHLSIALDELERIGVADVPVIGIAKEFEHIYVKGNKEPIILPEESKALHLLKRIRDEAHRFAISYHKSLRSKAAAVSALDEIRGIGPKRKKALIDHFGDVEKIKSADKDELLKVKGIDGKAAQAIIYHFEKR